VVGSASYDPFGGVLSQQGFTSPWGFAGEYHDPTTGLQYLRARWYQPGVGRFTQVDPFPGVVSLPLTQNPYVYGLNSPTNLTDPTGKDPLLVALGYAGLAGLLAGGAELWAQTAYYMIDLGCTWAQTWHLLNWGKIAGAAFNAALATFEYIAFATLLPEALIARIVLGFAVGAATNVVGDFAGRAVETFINHRLPQNNPFDFRTYYSDILVGGIFAVAGEIIGSVLRGTKIQAESEMNVAQLLQDDTSERILYTDISEKSARALTRRYFHQSLLIANAQQVIKQSDHAMKILNIGLNSTLWYILLTEE